MTVRCLAKYDTEPRAAYEAVATTQGVNGWWSNHTHGPDGVGSTMQVGLPDAPMTFDFEVTEDAPQSRVRWRCLAGPPEWLGTDISFDVQTDDHGQTSVLFSHDGWKTTQESFPFIAYSWAQILPRLKQHAEGRGPNPYFDF